MSGTSTFHSYLEQIMAPKKPIKSLAKKKITNKQASQVKGGAKANLRGAHK